MNKLLDFDKELNHINTTDFNIIAWCGVGTTEVKHSSMIADLLNPEGSHKCGDVFLKEFFKQLQLNDLADCDLQSTKVETEKSILENDRRLDIILTNENPSFCIIIENKTETEDSVYQLRDYKDYLDKERKETEKWLFYLTYNGDKASDKNVSDKEYQAISYSKHIIQWLESIKEVPENLELKLAIEQYCNFLKIISGETQIQIFSEIKAYLQEKKSISELKDILLTPNSLSEQMKQIIYEHLCLIYCKELAAPYKPDNVRIIEAKFNGILPFWCAFDIDGGRRRVELQPLSRNKKSYGKLYVRDMATQEVIFPNLQDLKDKQWDCNFYSWLENDAVTEIKESNKKTYSIEDAIKSKCDFSKS